MAIAAKSVSQVVVHMAISFTLAFLLTGSVAFGGLVAVIEPVVNVLLLPLHEAAWRRMLAGCQPGGRLATASKKASQAALHFVVAVTVLYCASGSLVLGGMLALIEPIANVILLPHHDRLWDRLLARLGTTTTVRAGNAGPALS